MRNGGDVGDGRDLEPSGLKRTNSRLAAGARALDEDLDLLEAVFHGAPRGCFSRHLRGKGRALARALEALAAGAAPGEHVALRVGQRNDRVIERGLDMRLAHRDVLLFATPGADDFLLWHALLLCLGLLTNADGLARATTGARIGAGALAANRKATPVTQAAVGANFNQPLDVERDLATQLAFHFGFFVDDVAQAAHLLVIEILDAQVRVDVGDRQDAPGGMGADTKDVGQRNLDTLFARNVNAGDPRHLSS